MKKDNISKLYGALKSKGYTDIGKDEDTFRDWLGKEGNVKTLYGVLSKKGYSDIGDEQQFADWVGVTPSSQAVEQPQEPVLASQVSESTYQPTQREVKEHILVNIPEMFKPKKNLADAPLGNAANAPELSNEKFQARIDVLRRNAQDPYVQKARNDAEMRGLVSEIDEMLEKEGQNEQHVFAGSSFMPAVARGKSYQEANKERTGNVSNLWAAKRMLEQSQYIADAARRGDTGVLSDVWQGFKDSLELEDFTFGAADVSSSAAILDAIKKVEKGEELSEAEDKLLRAAAVNMATQYYYASDLSRAYGMGQTTAESVPFILEMVINPLSSIGNSSVKTLLKHGLKSYVKQVGKGLMKGAAAGASMAATTGIGNVIAGTTDRLAKNYNFGVDFDGNLYAKEKEQTMGAGEAFARSFASRAIENQSEMIFKAFKPLGGFMKGVQDVLPGGVNKFFEMLSHNKVADAYRYLKKSPVFRNYLMKDIRNATQIGGLGEEYLEEVYNNLANFAIGEMSWEEVTSLDKNIDTFLGLVPTQVMFGMLGLGGAASMRYQTRRVLEDLQATMNEQQRRELEGLLDMGIDAKEVDVRGFIRGVMENQNYTIENKRDMIKAAFYVAKQRSIDELTEADVIDKVRAEYSLVDSMTDPSTGNYAEVNRLVTNPETGEREAQPGYVVGWIGEGEKRQPVFVADGMENTYENRMVLKPAEWDKESYREMPAEQVKTATEEMIREEAAAQAERESKYAPEVLNAQMQLDVPFETADAVYTPVSLKPEGDGWVVLVQPKDAEGKVASQPFTRELTNDEYHDMLQAQLEAQEAAATPMSTMESQASTPTSPMSTPMSEEGAAEQKAAQPKQPTLEEVVATLPKNKKGEIDYKAMTPKQQFQYTSLTESPEVALEDLQADIAAGQKEIEKVQEQLAKANGGQRAELRDKVRQLTAAQAELQSFYDSVTPKEEAAPEEVVEEAPASEKAEESTLEEKQPIVAEEQAGDTIENQRVEEQAEVDDNVTNAEGEASQGGSSEEVADKQARIAGIAESLVEKLGAFNENTAAAYAEEFSSHFEWKNSVEALKDAKAFTTYLIDHHFEKGFTTGLVPFYDEVSRIARGENGTIDAKEESRRKPLRERAKEWEKKLGVKVNLIESVGDVTNREVAMAIRNGQRVTGWFEESTGEVCFYLPNLESESEVDSTCIHEVVAHKGLRGLLGDKFDAFCDEVWESMSVMDKSKFINYPGVSSVRGKTEEETILKRKRAAADEYIAHLAENIDVTDSAWSKFAELIKQFLKALGLEPKMTNADIANAIKKSYQRLAERGAEGIRMRAVERLEENVGEVDAEKGDVRFAVRDVLKGEERAQAIKDLMAVTGRSKRTVEKWLKAEESLASVILNEDNVGILDMEADESVPSIWKNSDYPQGTVEFSNICKKRLPFTTTYQRLQKEFPDTLFDAQTLNTIRNTMKEMGEDVACALCFVEDRRQLLGEIGQGFIDAVKGMDVEVNDNQKIALDKLRESGDKYVPNLFDIITLDGMKELRKKHPAVAQAFIEYNNARGMQSGRLFQAYSAYNREILKYNKKKVESINNNGGLRIFSFSDFEAHHLIDLVQVLTDCAAKGIKVQGYTKVPEFAKAVKDTNAKINRSLIPKGVGYVDSDYVPKEGEAVSPNVINGKRLLFDTIEGIDVNNLNFFDSTGSKSVGNILVAINDEHARLAMADPFVDYIIGFHTGQSKAILKGKGIDTWVNYKNEQLDKEVVTDEKGNQKLKNASHHGLNIYTDVLNVAEAEGNPIKTAKQFTERFLEECAKRGYVPRFSRFLNRAKDGRFLYTPGYHKFLIDFKLFDKNGRILPQEAVVPKFDNAFNKQILDDYVKGVKEEMPNDAVYEAVKEAVGLGEGVKPEGNTRFRIANKNQEIFVSNAQKAVEGIKQEKGTPQQWLAMIEKNGGLKAGEDKWLGLSDWLKGLDKKSVTKAEILDFIGENKIQIEEVHYSEFADRSGVSKALADSKGIEFRDAFVDAFGMDSYGEVWVADEEEAIKLYNENNEDGLELDEYGYIDERSEDTLKEWAQGVLETVGANQINETRLDYTTKGLESKAEIALTVPTIKPWNEDDEIHFGDAGEGRAIAWIRFGETSAPQTDLEKAAREANEALTAYQNELAEKYMEDGGSGDPTEYLDMMSEDEVKKMRELSGKMFDAREKSNANQARVLVIDEIQSNRHQEGREKGYVDSKGLEEAIEQNKKAVQELRKQIGSRWLNQSEWTAEETSRFDALSDEYDSLLAKKKGIPEAPFEKNWSELAFKRMLRYAAENGFDKVAWTTGAQQAERYNLGNVIDSISISKSKKEDGKYHITSWDKDTLPIGIASGNKTPEELKELFGKEIAQSLIDGVDNLEEGSDTFVLEGADLEVGGEGMKGFYDKMLPSFVNKYVKKWGTKVQDIELPRVEQAGRIMHSVDVTDAMKESVMEGQTMFRISSHSKRVKAEVDKFTSKYASKDVLFFHGEMTDEEVAAVVPGYTANDIITYINNAVNGGYSDVLDKISIFADNNAPVDIEDTLFHENLHALLIDNQDIVKAFAEKSLGRFPKNIERIQELGYNDKDIPEEILVRLTAKAMVYGIFDDVIDSIPEAEFERLKELLIRFGYDYREEIKSRTLGESRRGTPTLLEGEEIHDTRGSERALFSDGGKQGERRKRKERLGKLFDQVADMGLDGVLGNKEYTTAMVDIFKAMPEGVRSDIADRALMYYGGSVAPAVSDYLNRQAKADLWDKVVTIVREALRKVGINLDLNGNEVKYILWRSQKKLDRNNLLEVAEDIDMKYRLKVGEYSTDDDGTTPDGGGTRFRIVYHGSGASFDKFDHRYMGTGEGNQAFGWGTYVTDVEGIGRKYAGLRADNSPMGAATMKWIEENPDYQTFITKGEGARRKRNVEGARAWLEEMKVKGKPADIIADYEQNLAETERMISEEGYEETLKNMQDSLGRNLYSVDIPDESEGRYIDYDLPMNKQGDAHKVIGDGLRAMGWEHQDMDGRDVFTLNGEKIVLNPGQSGADLYEELSDALGSAKNASKFLSDIGFTGIVYPANYFSGGMEGNAKNYVIFNEKDLKIMEHTRFRTKKPAKIDIADNRSEIIKRYDEELKTGMFNFQEAFQDRMLSLKVLMNEIVDATGKKVRSFEDAYEAENQLSSINKVDQERYIKKFYTPLVDYLKAISKKHGEEIVRRYIYCKSGLERNEVLRQRDADEAFNAAKEELDEKLAKNQLTQAQYDALLQQSEDERQKTLSEDVDYSGIRGMLFNVRAQELFEQYQSGALTETQYEQKIEDLKNDKANVVKDWKDFAEQSVADLESRATSSELDELWSKINAATNETLRIDFESGMIDRETYEAEKKMMKYYVPLRDWENTKAEEMYEYRHDMTPAVTTNQQRAKGRESEAANPMATIALMAQNAIVRGNRNKMKMKLYSFVVNRPTDLASVRNVWYVRIPGTKTWEARYADTSAAQSEAEIKQIMEQFEADMELLEEQGEARRGKLKQGMGYRASRKQKDEHVVVVMINGKEYGVYINGNPRAAQAVNGLTNAENVDDGYAWIDNLKRLYGGSLTSWNPDFIIPNAVRDTLHASTMIYLDKGALSAAKYAWNVPKVTAQVFAMISGAGKWLVDSSTQKYFEEFVANGGETGYTEVHTLEDYKKEYQKLMNEAKGLKAGIKKGVKLPFQKIAKVLEAANRIAEDVNRFNAYVTSRESGEDIVRSISAAKNISVNFNRKGALHANSSVWGKVASFMSRWILFFNPSVQGIYQLVSKTKANPKRATALIGTILASGFFMPMLNEMLVAASGDDEEDDYWNQSDFKRRNNWMLFTGDGYFSVPLPPVFREIYGMGDIIYGVMTGHIPPQRAVYDVLTQVQSAIGFVTLLPEVSQEPDVKTWLKGFAPDLASPILDVMSNTNFLGRPIAKWKDYNQSDPEHERVYKGTGKHWIALSELLNEMGGNETRRSDWFGNLFNPAMMEHLFTSYTGGIGKTINNLAGMAIDAAVGDTDNMDVFRKTPIISRFYTPNDEKTVYPGIDRKFYEFSYQYNNISKSLKKSEKGVNSKEHPEWQKHIDEMKKNGEYDFVQYFKREQKRLKKLEDRLKADPNNKELEKKVYDKKAEIAAESFKILSGQK